MGGLEMDAGALVEPFPIVTLRPDVLTAARTMGDRRLPGLIVCKDDGRPHTILPGSQVLRFMIPAYVQDDPALARVYDERASEKLMTKLSSRTVRDLLPEPRDRDELPVVDPDATILGSRRADGAHAEPTGCRRRRGPHPGSRD